MSKDVETSGKYVLPSKLNYEDYLTAIGQRAQDSYKKEVLAAGNAYSSALSNAGANATALSSMGLTGSGYSTYLDSQAYAQKQNAVNLAKTSLDSELNKVEGLYADYLVQQETNRKNAYQGIYDKLPTLSLGDIDRLGAMDGLDATAINELKTAKNELTYASLLGSEYGQKTLNDLVGTGHLYADSPQYNALKTDMIKIDDSDLPNMFKDQSYDKSTSTLEKLKPLIDDATYAKLKKQFDADYGVTRANITLKQGTLLKKNAGKSNRAISVQDSAGNKYTVTYSGNALRDELKKAADANNINDNEVFKLRGNLYIKIDGEYYELSNASLTNKNDYTNLMNLFA